MNLLKFGFVVALSLLLSGARALAQDTVDFTHEDAFTHPVLSPDGQTLAYTQIVKDQHLVFLLDLQTNKRVAINLESANKWLRHEVGYLWTTGRRLALQFGNTYYTVDRDGRNAARHLPYGALLHNFRDEKTGDLLVYGHEYFDVSVPRPLVGPSTMRQALPFIHRISTTEGSYASLGVWRRTVDNNGRIFEWAATAEGEVLAATEFDNNQFRVVHRKSESVKNWTPLNGLDWTDPDSRAMGFSRDGKTLYVSRISPQGTWALYPYDLRGQTLGEPLVSDARYDVFRPVIVNRRYDGPYDSFVLTSDVGSELKEALIYSSKEKELLGVRYTTDVTHTLWLDEGLKEMQAVLDAALTGRINSIVSLSDDLQRLALLSWSATDPGSYYLYDRSKNTLEKLFSRRPWVNPAQAAEVKPVRFKGRSGVELNGYITLPPGLRPEKLSLLIVTGGKKRAEWVYDRFSQFMASRGYGVVRLNHRGLTGLGEEFLADASTSLLQRAIKDIEDVAIWTIESGLADPKRIALYGSGSEAGLCALLAVQEKPEWFRCAIVQEPLVDLTKDVDLRFGTWRYEWESRLYGDAQRLEDLARLQADSPALNMKPIRIPLLVQHNDDEPANHYYKRVRNWAKRAGPLVEFRHDFDEKYGFETLAKYWQEDLDFLQQHMPAD